MDEALKGVLVHSVLTSWPQVVFPEATGWDYGSETVVVYQDGKVIAEFVKQAVAYVEFAGVGAQAPDLPAVASIGELAGSGLGATAMPLPGGASEG